MDVMITARVAPFDHEEANHACRLEQGSKRRHYGGGSSSEAGDQQAGYQNESKQRGKWPRRPDHACRRRAVK